MRIPACEEQIAGLDCFNVRKTREEGRKTQKKKKQYQSI